MIDNHIMTLVACKEELLKMLHVVFKIQDERIG